MIKKIGSKYLDFGFKIDKTDYNTTMERFHDILNNKIYMGRPKIKQTTVQYKSPIKADKNNLRLTSNATAKEIDHALQGTKMEGLGGEFVKAEERYGVNAWFLAALAAHESGYGSSQIAKDKNNLFGFMAYDRSPYSSAMGFKNNSSGINYVAKYLSDEYLTSDGAYFNGLSIDGVGKNYATDRKWADKVSFMMNELIKKSQS